MQKPSQSPNVTRVLPAFAECLEPSLGPLCSVCFLPSPHQCQTSGCSFPQPSSPDKLNEAPRINILRLLVSRYRGHIPAEASKLKEEWELPEPGRSRWRKRVPKALNSSTKPIPRGLGLKEWTVCKRQCRSAVCKGTQFTILLRWNSAQWSRWV